MLDATTGQNGLSQARLFHQAADLSGVVLTKVDGTAKGGIAVAIRSDLGIPVKLVGSGERLEDLQPFDAARLRPRDLLPRGVAAPPLPWLVAPMFDALTDKLQGVFSGLRGRGKLTESDIDQAMRAIRLSLLEADVSLPVVKQLTTAIAERAKGAEVMESLTPDQQVVKIVSDELTALMGEANVALPLASKPPTIVLMAGLQGSGKTTCAAKLARYFHSQGRAPMLVACDVHRPAAAEQLAVLGEQIGVPGAPRGRRPTPRPSPGAGSRPRAAAAATWSSSTRPAA